MTSLKTEADIKKVTAQLAEPFDPFDLEWRPLRVGETNGKKWAMVLAYVTNRAIMERLDSVFGIAGWQNVYKEMSNGSIICGISAKFGDEWVTKYDGSEQTDISATKGGLSGAMKRAGVQWGIGRYLYQLDQTFANLIEGRGDDYQITTYVKEINGDKSKAGNYHYNRPKLETWALPKADDDKK